MSAEDCPTVDLVEKCLVEFYGGGVPADQPRWKELHTFLVGLQNTRHVWSLIGPLLNCERNYICGYFAANCLYEKLSRNWKECLPAADNEIQNLRQFLVATLESRTNTDGATSSKLQSSLAALVVQTVPDLWERPFEDLYRRWMSEHAQLLLRLLGEVVHQLRILPVPLKQRSLARAVLIDDGAVLVKKVCREKLDRAEHVEAVTSCLLHWIDYPGSDLAFWADLILSALELLRNAGRGEHSACVSRILNKLADNDQLSRLPQTLNKLMEFTVSFVESSVAVDGDSLEAVEESLNAAAGLFEKQAGCILVALNSSDQQHSADAARRLLKLLLSFSTTSGYYPVHETISEVPANFWQSLENEMSCTERMSEGAHVELKRIYWLLMRGSVKKLRFPKQEDFATWDRSSVEMFDGYRQTVGDVLASCYRLLGEESLSFLDQSILPATTEEEIEAVVYAIKSVADFVSADSQSVHHLLLTSLPAVLSLEKPCLGKTVVQLIDRLTHVVAVSDHSPQLFASAVKILLPFVFHADVHKDALLALEHLMRERIPNCSTTYDAVLEQCYQYFAGSDADAQIVARSAADRLMSLRCLGYALSTKRRAFVLESLDSLLSPHLDELQRLLNSATSRQEVSKDQLLFKLNVVATLIETLTNSCGTRQSEKSKTDSDDVGTANPAALVLDKSLGLFESLLEASGGDVDVAENMCRCLRSGVSALAEQPAPIIAPLVERLCSLLTRMLRSAEPSERVFSVCKLLLLLFADEQAVGPALRQAVADWTLQMEECLTVEQTPLSSATVDLADAYLQFCHQLVKKHWKFLSAQNSEAVIGSMTEAALWALACDCSRPVTVKQAALFLSTLVDSVVQSRLEMAPLLEKQRAARAVQLCQRRLRSELLTSSVEYLADVLFVFARNFLEDTRTVLKEEIESDPVVGQMISQLANKRKFRESAKLFNLRARRAISTVS